MYVIVFGTENSGKTTLINALGAEPQTTIDECFILFLKYKLNFVILYIFF